MPDDQPIPRSACRVSGASNFQGGRLTKITVRNNGSVRIEGEFTICDQDGKEFGLGGRTAISLCRCGHSETKPFCDGSHKRVGFNSEIRAYELPPPPAAPKPPGTN